MPQIGEFTRTKSGFAGYVRTLTLDLEITLSKAEPTEAENAPDHRLFHGDGDLTREIGAVWARTGEKAGEYFSVLIDDPMLTQPIRANLFRNCEGSVWSLQWSRPPKRNGTL